LTDMLKLTPNLERHELPSKKWITCLEIF